MRCTGVHAWCAVAALAMALPSACLSEIEPHDRKPPRPMRQLDLSEPPSMAAGQRASRGDTSTERPASASGGSPATTTPDVQDAGSAGEPADAPDADATTDAPDSAAPAADSGSGERSFVSLAVAPGSPLTKAQAETPETAPPAGWEWYPIERTYCRDGSGAGIYLRRTESDKLLIYFEGGGACTTSGFCAYNPPNIDSVLTGAGETLLDTALGVGTGRQQPGVYNDGTLGGIFATDAGENPLADWNMVYIPYCTGDLHFGSNEAGTVAELDSPQQFVGHRNTREFMSHVVPTWKDVVDHVVVTGASAGSFGALFNFSMIADSFGASVRVDAVFDSGAPLRDSEWAPCLQQRWRELWELDAGLPPDCPQCFNSDGGGLIGLADFLLEKHPEAHFAVISSLHDEVVRLLFTPGENDCEYADVADPVELTVGQILGGQLLSEDDYEAGLLALRTRYEASDRVSTYYLGGTRDALHQHIFRPRLYERTVGQTSLAQFLDRFLAGSVEQIGP